jgi:hypothetical protein
MIGFNTLLRDEEINPGDVSLARHQSARRKDVRLTLWLAHDGSFELFQRIQRIDRVSGIKFVAAFVATPLNETLFVGLFENCGVGKAPARPRKLGLHLHDGPRICWGFLRGSSR